MDGSAVKPRDVRMIETCEDAFFLAEMADEVRVTEPAFP